MTYADWRAGFESDATAQPARRAQLWNLEHEQRVAASVEDFKNALAQKFDAGVASGAAAGPRALQALDETRDGCKPISSPWLGLLPFPRDASAPGGTFSCFPLSLIEIARLSRGPFVDTSPGGVVARNIRLDKPLKAREGPGGTFSPKARFIWVTFAPAGRRFPDDPNVVIRELGLPHFSPGPEQYVYRVSLDFVPQQTFIPTCFDAGLYEAWAPPPAGHVDPWGMTRDTQSGESRWPELLTETAAHLTGSLPVATLISPDDRIVAFDQPVHFDCMANRI